MNPILRSNRGQSWTQLAYYFLVPPARLRIYTSRGSFHHMSIKSAEKRSKSLIYRAKQTKERERYMTDMMRSSP